MAATASQQAVVGAGDGTSSAEQARAASPSHWQHGDAPSTGTSTPVTGRLRGLSDSFEQSRLPEGFSAATGNIASTIFARQPAKVLPTPAASEAKVSDSSTIQEESCKATPSRADAERNLTTVAKFSEEPAAAAPYRNGYHFPPPHSAWQSTKLGLVAFWKYFTTPLGFVVTIYGLNIVAWGGMLFLLLCNAAPAMCYPTCNDINSPRRKWIEWDSQILNALFCVTGFGLAPWRFRDLYYLLKYRMRGSHIHLRRLAGIHAGWFRLQGSDTLDPSIGPKTEPTNVDEHVLPFPLTKTPDPPLTGVRAPPTKLWKLDLVIWLMVWNTFFQICLATFMWALNRFDRPSWTTGLFVGLACLVAGYGGWIMFAEGKKVKSVEGVPVSAEDLERLHQDRELGIYHYNNIAAKEEKRSKKAGRNDNDEHIS